MYYVDIIHNILTKRSGKLGVEIIFKIAGIGILTAILGQVLKQSGKDEIATLTTLSGLIIVLLMVLDLISDLFSSIRAMFNF